MRILFAGNSHASCVKRAFDSRPEILAGHDVFFFVTTGGAGPSFKLQGDEIRVIGDPVTRTSSEEVKSLPLSSYDVVVLSALGYVDGGFCYNNVITKQGLLFAYKPKGNEITSRYISRKCYEKVVFSSLRKQNGVRFLSSLRAVFDGKIMVQPMPIMSEMVRDDPRWALNQMYGDPIGAHEFFCRTRDEFLKTVCGEVSAELLPYPVPEWR